MRKSRAYESQFIKPLLGVLGLFIILVGFYLILVSPNKSAAPVSSSYYFSSANTNENKNEHTKPYFYKVVVSKEQNAPPPMMQYGMGSYLAKRLGWPDDIQRSLNLGLGELFYDTRTGDPNAQEKLVNGTYYIYIQPKDLASYHLTSPLTIDHIIPDSEVQVKAAVADESLLQYMTANSKYCISDIDCELGKDFCGNAVARNHYELVSSQLGAHCEPDGNHFTETKCIENTCKAF